MAKLNLNGLGKKDIEKFYELPKEREKIIRDTSASEIKTNFSINKLAKNLHPKVQYVKVAKIIEENEETKTFVLTPDLETSTKQLARFKPGQYISIEVPIGEAVYRRPYTLSTSPKKVEDNIYTITIRRVPYGKVSNYFLDHVEIGDTFKISAPTGEFYYSPIRDARHIIGIAGGSGITPFMAMAEAINDGTLDCKLTILYGVKSKSDIIYRERLEEITSKTDKVKLAYVMVVDDDTEFASSFIDRELLDKYIEEENSFFVCGPVSIYERMNEVLKEYNLPIKYIRHDAFMSEMEIYKEEEYNVKILTHNEEINIKCNGKETLLAAMEKNGVIAPSRCHVGTCGFCRSKLISGKVKTFNDTLRIADREYNYIHPCSSYPESDVVLKLPK